MRCASSPRPSPATFQSVTTHAKIGIAPPTLCSRFFADNCAIMSNQPDPPLSPAGLRFWGVFTIALGALILLAVAGVLPSKGGDAPPWVVACAASVFVLAGILLVLRS